MIIVKLHIKIKHQQVSNNFITRFHDISISGRYIYGYLCLREVINEKRLENLPPALDDIICEFVSSNRLDLWQSRADEVLPSVILNEKNDESYYEYISYAIVLPLREYYKSQPSIVNDLIEKIIDLGLSNLYCGFDTNFSLPYIEQIVKLMNEHSIELPDFGKVASCSVKERHGWGELTNMSNFLS